MDLPGQGLGTAFLHVDLAPDTGDELLLLGCPVHHGGRRLCSELWEDTDPVAELQTPRRLLSTAGSSSPSRAAGSLAGAGVGVRAGGGAEGDDQGVAR